MLYIIFLQVGVHKIRYWDIDWQKSLSFLLSSTSRQYYNSKTVDELLFTGYSDNLLTMSKAVPVDDVPTFDRFGWFYMVRLLIKQSILFLLFSDLFLTARTNKSSQCMRYIKLNIPQRLIVCT